MKRKIYQTACLILLVLIISLSSCSKENQTLLMMSAHTWVVVPGSAGGVVGDEYKFYDNRLFFQHRSGVLYDDGEWNFTSDYQSYGYGTIGCIIVESGVTPIQLGYDIKKITDTELVLLPLFFFNYGAPFALPAMVLEIKE